MMSRTSATVVFACALIATAGLVRGATGYADSAPFDLNTAAISGTGGGNDLPQATRLGTCTPNPFNPSTTIHFDLARAATVRLDIYDLRGRLVRILAGPAVVPAGRYEVPWDGRDDRGTPAPGGVYVYRLSAGEFTAARSMTLVK